jgi:hypothetical protein
MLFRRCGTLKLNSRPSFKPELQVREELGRVDGQQMLDTFHFYDQAFLDDEVDTIRRRQAYSVVNNWEAYLVLNVQTRSRQFAQQARVDCALEDTGAECTVHLECATNHGVAGFIRASEPTAHYLRHLLCVLRTLCVLREHLRQQARR